MRIPLRESPYNAWADRLVALALVVAAVAFVMWLSDVDPDPRGHGTHEKLGMEPCGWARQWDMPCPTCGVTTAATHLVHLQPVAAFAVQPFGASLALGGLWVAAVALWSLLRGESFLVRVASWPYGTILVITVLLLLGSWGYRAATW